MIVIEPYFLRTIPRRQLPKPLRNPPEYGRPPSRRNTCYEAALETSISTSASPLAGEELQQRPQESRTATKQDTERLKRKLEETTSGGKPR
ncbi:hypothetical protein KC19_5G081200 [Ceratodon purpureus]|uniref:Uncharacterized protein n=1 Tax=Ceratodon purpureus TaxID=3225 RepID=A0A8T0I1A9_CERPU|nr:hypothetical protein KC19_5G081200 [Ceratodon purpureus]